MFCSETQVATNKPTSAPTNTDDDEIDQNPPGRRQANPLLRLFTHTPGTALAVETLQDPVFGPLYVFLLHYERVTQHTFCEALLNFVQTSRDVNNTTDPREEEKACQKGAKDKEYTQKSRSRRQRKRMKTSIGQMKHLMFQNNVSKVNGKQKNCSKLVDPLIYKSLNPSFNVSSTQCHYLRIKKNHLCFSIDQKHSIFSITKIIVYHKK